MSLKWFATTTVVALGLSSTLASASSIRLENISVAWVNSDPDASTLAVDIEGDPSTPLTDAIKWGTPASGAVATDPYVLDQSGYRVTVNDDPSPDSSGQPTDGSSFVIGTFTHFNNPITGVTLNDVQLQFSFDAAVDAQDDGNFEFLTGESFLFDFVHDETPNTAGTCAEPNVGPPCADIVTVSVVEAQNSVVLDNIEYTVNILGFQEEGAEPSSRFVSTEGGFTTANVLASFTAEVIPLPAGVWLLGTALAGFGVMRRRKKPA